jgi:UDP-N-acetylglucosamine transferase subunit ALG13
VTPGATVFVTVGTDFHPFDRLVGWTDRWLTDNASRGVTGLVQTGTSAHPTRADFADYLGHAEMKDSVASAAAVVTHGGPGSIMLCSYLGKKPIVVPRESARGEHVDDHQVVFSRRLAAEGRIDIAETEERFAELLERALSAPANGGSSRDASHVAEAVKQFEQLVDEMLTRPSGGNGSRHRHKSPPRVDRGG